jgi:UDP-N-acetylglucosamine 1-carboxyvinyltransferase
MDIGLDNIIIHETKQYRAIDIKTLVYPGFATDLQQIMAPFLTQCKGRSSIEETIYENRFQNIPELDKMGANTQIRKDNRKVVIRGKTPLKGAKVTATDLRGGASLLVAGLIAEGVTTIDNISYILRGYDEIVEKLTAVGAKIEII